MSDDVKKVMNECSEALDDGGTISDACARVIANFFHNGQYSPSYSFVSTGAIESVDELWEDLTDDYTIVDRNATLTDESGEDAIMLVSLKKYLDNAGIRDPQLGWNDLWL